MRSAATQVIPVLAESRTQAAPETLRALHETTKPGITRLVTLTAGLGFVLSAVSYRLPVHVSTLAYAAFAMMGVYLASSGVNAINQWWESPRDARMRRTRKRPIPSGRLTPGAVAWFGLLATIAGVVLTAVFGGPASGLLTLASAVFYVLLYTPMKTRSAWNTLVGAIPGALPPVIGGAIAAHLAGISPREAMLEPIGWALFLMMVVWQLPHFFAIAAMYKEDYRAGGFRMLTTIDPDGRLTAWSIFITAVALVPASLLIVPASGGVIGVPFAVVALLAGGVMVWTALRMLRSSDQARGVFFASIAYLPVLCIALTAEALVRVLA